MFTKQDARFDQMAADPVRRREAIANLNRRRSLFSCVGVFLWAVFAVSIVVEMFDRSAEKFPGRTAITAVFGLMQIVIVNKYDSDLKLLRTIERQCQDDNAK